MGRTGPKHVIADIEMSAKVRAALQANISRDTLISEKIMSLSREEILALSSNKDVNEATIQTLFAKGLLRRVSAIRIIEPFYIVGKAPPRFERMIRFIVFSALFLCFILSLSELYRGCINNQSITQTNRKSAVLEVRIADRDDEIYNSDQIILLINQKLITTQSRSVINLNQMAQKDTDIEEVSSQVHESHKQREDLREKNGAITESNSIILLYN